MGAWLDFLQMALALGIGWLGWVVVVTARSTGRADARADGRPTRPSARPAHPRAAAHLHALDRDR